MNSLQFELLRAEIDTAIHASELRDTRNLDLLNRRSELMEVVFTQATPEQLGESRASWLTMAQTAVALSSYGQDVLASSRGIEPFVLGAFLEKPMTPAQISHVNEIEAPAFAKKCVAFQKDVAKIQISETFEPMRHMPTAFSIAKVAASFSEEPYPNQAGEWSGKPQEFWARSSVVERLVMAGKILERVGLELHFLEAFRPVGVQEAMFKRRIATTRREHPDWQEEDLINEALSKTASTPRLASHKAGAAVDMFLAKPDGQWLDFGHQYPDGGIMVSPSNIYLTFEQWHNRQLLKVATALAGLTMYIGEDWHFSFGDNVAAVAQLGTSAVPPVADFGPIKEFDRDTGEILGIYESSELDDVFAAT